MSPPHDTPPATAEPPGRRSLLGWLTVGIGALVGAVLAVPAALFVGHPLRRRTVTGGEEPLPVGALDRLPEGTPVRATVIAPARFDAWTRFDKVALGAIWLVRSGSSVTAFSTVCPHAGCFVDWEPEKQRFACPCHGSTFAKEGACTGGPSPRALDALDAEVKDGQVLVRYQRFRQATTKKEAI